MFLYASSTCYITIFAEACKKGSYLLGDDTQRKGYVQDGPSKIVLLP